jgi:hypothetical protein
MTRPRRNAERRASRRFVKAGFPVAEPFTCREEVDSYLAHDPDKITCLLCGKLYRKLGLHLHTIHGLSVDDYKLHYGIPAGRSLTSDECAEAYRSAKTPEEWSAWIAHAVQARRPDWRNRPRRRRAEWCQEENADRFRKINEARRAASANGDGP